MTIAAALQTKLAPALFGDLLLSHRAVNSNIHLPTTGTVTSELSPVGRDYSPASLRPKIAIVAPEFAISWAGDDSLAGSVVDDLVTRWDFYRSRQRRCMSMAEITASISGVFANKNASQSLTAILGWYLAEGKAHLLRHGPHKEVSSPSPGIERAWVTGTGSDLFTKALRALVMPAGPDETDAVRVALTSLPCIMIAHELLAGSTTIGAAFGGGYETVVGTSAGFQYLDDITHLFWPVDLGTDGKITFRVPFKLFKLAHYHGAPIIRSTRVRTGGPTERAPDNWLKAAVDLDDNEWHAVAPFTSLKERLPHWPLGPEDAPKFSSAVYVNAFVVRQLGAEKPVRLVIMRALAGHETGGMDIADEGEFSFRCSAQFLEAARKQIAYAFASKP
jgi:hypothetical protein